VQRILTFSRKREVARVPLKLERTVRESLQLLRASLPTTIEIRQNLEPNTPDVLSDETQLHQVLMNLATNAAHAMAEGGILQVQTGPHRVTRPSVSRPNLAPGLYARLSVIDTGLGMSEEVQNRAFEPFFTTKAPGLGTGLGLSVIHGIVESHGGAIDIRSAPGQGTRVDVYLPAHVQVRADTVESLRPVKHVLLVDDEPHLANMLRRQLRSLGYRVTMHTSSLEALENFRAQPKSFHLLISDNTMPHLTGLALAEEVHAARPDLPVLLISGLGPENGDVRARYVSRVLSKPYSLQALRAAIHELIGDPGLDSS
jgi:two-component system, cell cycle sensor histidine kinase and response regulator CckA